MTVSTFIAFLYGMFLEVAWLWDQAQGKKFFPWQRTPEGWQRIPMRKLQWAVVVLGLGAAALIGILEFLGVSGASADISQPIPFMLYTAIGLFVFGAGVIWDGLLPRVNEITILGVQLIVMLGLVISGGRPNPWATTFVLIVPAGVMLYLVARKQPPGMATKAIIYLWYTFSLILMLYQSGFGEMISRNTFSLPEAFVLGTTFIFFLLHALFAIRFFIIVSSLILPRNRRFLPIMISRLFSDEQIPIRRFILLLAIVSGVIALNAWIGLIDTYLFVSLSVMIGTQVLFQAKQ
ncbi:MAG TPA: hypothetical protein PKM21_04370 [Anaerolineales bacterium]|nr:hypothetical protein [Anaerolineales bacterium]